ncbi:MAG: ATP-dependent RNA helicase HrpA [Planctomycetia bacterium]|nr:ATP-dependent RNA helicase HrpA [Planctomycetia bacterium]
MRVPVLQVSGRMFPVEVLYRPLAAEDDEREPDLVRNVVAAVVELAQKPPTPPSPTSGGGSLGDVLIFMATEHDIHETAKALRSRTLPGDYPGRETLVLPLYARLPAAQQQLVFQPHSHRKIVIATNVAESSLTVPGIRYVIDPGTARISRYAARSKVQRLPVEAISQASADQRKGRCGRVGPGVCVRLYSEEDYLSRERFTPPEIQRTNLAAVILQTKALGLGEIEEFPFLDPPRPGAVRDGYQTLFEIGALGAERDLTELGRKLARIPADPRIARMIVAAHDEGCLAEVLIIASALEIQDPRERPAEKRQAAQESHAQFLHPESDFLAHLKLWDFYHHLKETLSRSALARACRQNFLSLARLWEWSDIHRQLLQVAAEAGMKPTAASQSPRREDYGAIHRALLTGLLSNVAHLGEGREYTVAGGVKMHLWPGSGLFAKTPKWVMAAELVETSRRYLRTVAKIDVEWIEPLALHLVNRSYSEPQWDRKGGSAIAFEKVSLFGLPIVPRRRVRLGKIDPATAQELMIRDGLVPGEIDTRAEFLQHNLKLAEEAEKLRAKARRNDLLRDEEARFEFYDARLPADVYDAPSLETWRKEAERKEPKRLFMRLEDLLRDEARDVRAEDFPDAIAVDQMKLALEYRLEPGAEGDGITLTVPKEAVGQIDPRRLGWLVPGLLEQKIAALIKTLPKDLRRLCVPVPETAKRVVGELRFGHGSMETQAAAALCKLTGQEVRAEMFEADKLPPHLRMNVRVVDAEGATVAASRDLAELREKVGPSAAPIEIVDDPRFMRDGIKRWDFGDLPEHVTVARGGITLKAFPALVDAGDAVSLRLFDSPELAARQMRSGLRRLFYLAEGKSLRPGLPNAEALLLRASTFIKPDEFRRQAAQRIAERAFLAEGELPRTEADFLALQKFGRSRIAAATQEVAGVLAALVEAQHLARVALESLPKGPLAHAAQDVKVQLAALLPPRFLVEAPWQWLKEFPRYLRAIQSRLEKLPRNVDRDRRHTEEVARLWDEYAKRAAESERLSIVDEELVAYRYLLEEYRVSLFAQELGTAVPVSPKRLAKQWEKVGLAKGRAG